MKSVPKIVGTLQLVCYSPIDERHRFFGKTRQIVKGQLMGAMAGLVICQTPDSQEFYLFGCDADWNVVTDTWHQSLLEAKDQAEFEYEGISQTWSYVDSSRFNTQELTGLV
jgi:hypothetical protein